ncbi:MAG: hypothetical protein H7201_17435 [Candidatus Saccharibacteria bacterium]|nr:hypothetical protein [Microbacteriaceae bacterium]
MTSGGRTIGVHYAPEMIEWLNEIIEGCDVDLVWVTSWLQEGLILKLVDQLGLLQGGRLVPAPTPRLSGGFCSRWKSQRILAYQRESAAPFGWIDDESGEYVREVRGSTRGTPSLILQPDALEGIRPRHLTTLQSFYAGLPGAKVA